jgi:hypothetical protein
MNFFIIFLTVIYKYIFVITKHIYTPIYISILLIIMLLCTFKIYHKIIKNEMPRIENWSSSTLLIMLIIIYLTIIGGDANFLIPFILSIAFSYSNIDKFVKYFLISSIICFIATIALNTIGIIPDQVQVIRIDQNNVKIIRNCLGFEHPNNGFLFLLPIVFGIYYLAKNIKQRIYGFIISLLLSLYVYYQTMTRTGMIIICIYLFIAYLLDKKILNQKKILKMGRYSFFILSIISLLIAYIWGSDPYNDISILLTGRPFIWNAYINQGTHFFGNFFGHPEEIYKGEFMPCFGDSLDNYFIFILYYYGLFGFILLGILYYKALKYCEYKNDIKLYIIIIGYMLYGITEANNSIFSINFSHIFLFLPYFIRKGVNYNAESKSFVFCR